MPGTLADRRQACGAGQPRLHGVCRDSLKRNASYSTSTSHNSLESNMIRTAAEFLQFFL